MSGTVKHLAPIVVGAFDWDQSPGLHTGVMVKAQKVRLRLEAGKHILCVIEIVVRVEIGRDVPRTPIFEDLDCLDDLARALDCIVLDEEHRVVPFDGLPCASKHLPLRTFNVDLDKAAATKVKSVQGDDVDQFSLVGLSEAQRAEVLADAPGR